MTQNHASQNSKAPKREKNHLDIFIKYGDGTIMCKMIFWILSFWRFCHTFTGWKNPIDRLVDFPYAESSLYTHWNQARTVANVYKIIQICTYEILNMIFMT